MITRYSVSQLQLQTIRVTLPGKTRTFRPVLHQDMVSAAFIWYFQGPSYRLDSWDPSRRVSLANLTLGLRKDVEFTFYYVLLALGFFIII